MNALSCQYFNCDNPEDDHLRLDIISVGEVKISLCGWHYHTICYDKNPIDLILRLIREGKIRGLNTTQLERKDE